MSEDPASNGDDPAAPTAAAGAVEDATAADLDRLVECWTALVDHGRTHGLHLLSDPNQLVARQTLAAAVADDRVLVARHADRVVGFCSLALETGGFQRDVTRGLVENLYVEPAARGAGLGSALLAAGEARLADLGADAVVVETLVADVDVQAFYRDRGYEPHRVALEKPLDGTESRNP